MKVVDGLIYGLALAIVLGILKKSYRVNEAVQRVGTDIVGAQAPVDEYGYAGQNVGTMQYI